jgi:hypothetical protein
VVEILEQPETVDLRQVGIRLALGNARCDLDRYLLEANGRLEGRLVGGG